MLIVDLSCSVAGAFCGRLLGLRGDRVVAVGPLRRPNPDGEDEGHPDWVEEYLRFGIDKFAGDAASLEQLLQQADVLLTGWDAGRPSLNGDIRSLNPNAVEVVVSSFGCTGPYAEFKGSPLVDWASGGYLYITGLPEREPLAGPENLPAYVAGYLAASAVEVGLRMRKQGSDGPRLDVSTMESMAAAHQTTFSNLAANGEIRKRRRHAQPMHPLDITQCADGWVSVAVVTDAQYEALVEVIGESRLATDERFSTGQSRHEHSDAFDALVRNWYMARSADEVVEILQEHRVPAVKMVDAHSIIEDPQLRYRGYWQTWREGQARGVLPGNPIRVTSVTSPSAPDRVLDRPVTSGALPLSDTLVVDFTDYWAGPMATRIFSDLGATVVRVERPGARSQVHPAGRFTDWKMHRGKLSLAVNLKREEGRAVVYDLLDRADLFVENFRPGVVERLGFGYDEVANRNPGLVYLSLSGFGQDGPRSGWASFGPLLEAASSIQARTKYADSVPMLLGHSLPDAVGGFVGVFAALNSLRSRTESGAGARICVSQLECYAAICGEAILEASVDGLPHPDHQRSRRIFRCNGDDAWVVIDAMAAGDLAKVAIALDCDCSTDAIAAVVADLDKWDVAQLVQERGVPAFPVLDASELAADRHLAQRGFMIDLEVDDRTFRMPSLPIQGDPEVARFAPRSPASGQHSEYVMRRFLGYDDGRIDETLASGAVVQG